MDGKFIYPDKRKKGDRIMSKMYLLCELDDQNYTEPSFSIYKNKNDAFNIAMVSVGSCFGNEDFTMEISKSKTRIDTRWETSTDAERFLVSEIKEFEADEDYLLVWHHAYNGVDFKILKQGTYEECFAEQKRQIRQIYNDDSDFTEYNDDFDFENDNVVDRGEEWEIFSIIKVGDYIVGGSENRE